MVLLCSPVAKYRFVIRMLPFIFCQKLFQKPHELIFKISLRASVWWAFSLIHSSREPCGNMKPFLFSGWHPHNVCHPAPWNPPRGELPTARSHDVCVCKIVKGIMNQTTLLLVNPKHSPVPVTQCMSPFSPSQVDDLGWKFKFQLFLKCWFIVQGFDELHSTKQTFQGRIESTEHLLSLNHASLIRASIICCLLCGRPFFIISLFYVLMKGKTFF